MEKKRFLKRKVLFIALEILWLVSSLHTWSIAENTNDVVSFEWQDKNYSINAREIAETVNINIDEYPFYIVVTDKQRSDIIIYYSKTRFVASTYFDNYAIGNGQQPVFKITVQSDGRVTTKNTELNGIEDDIRLKEDVRFKLFIASNQDLLLKDNKTKAFEQNSGYIYDISNEKEDKCEEMVKIKNETIVYERAAMNHNEMTTLVQGSIVKRIKKEVNVMNGHTWDKIILANGREGYVFSDELEAVEEDEYSNVVVEYKDIKYNVYFPTLSNEVNINEYPFYVAVTDKQRSNIIIYYSKTRFVASTYFDNFAIGNGQKPVFKITVQSDGRVTTKNTELNGIEDDIRLKEDVRFKLFIASNQDIYCNGDKIFTKYIYDKNGLRYRTDIGLDDIEMTEGVYEAIKQAEEMYNSMNIEEIIIAYPQLLGHRGEILAAAELAENIYPNAGEALIYFLNKGGEGGIEYERDIYGTDHTMRRISVQDALEGNAAIEKKFIRNVEAAVEIANKLEIDENSPVTFVNAVEDSGAAKKENGEDWYLAIHNYRIRLQCTVAKHGDDYLMKMKYEIIDYYDWDPNTDADYSNLFQGHLPDNILNIIAKYLYTMHKAGLARNYTNAGTADYEIVWNKNAVDDYKIVKKP